jgi:DNA-binding winged helix-turn-helix (wHTH) protein/predicted ATPase
MGTGDLRFGPFRLDAASQRLERDGVEVRLRPKTFAVLRHLLGAPGRLITKDALLDAVWGDTVVSESVLTVCLRELREALDDDARSPRYVETVHRRGYRFLAAIDVGDAVPDAPIRTPAALVGRDAALERLHTWLAVAREGQRQLVFVTGDAGIGKTSLVDAFLDRLRPDDALWTATGQCVEHYGAAEAYLPVLEAMGRLCRGPGGERLAASLRRLAPTWVAELPALAAPGGEPSPSRSVDVPRQRMLREIADALEVVTAERTVVLVLEDLHWCDPSTVDLIAYLARRREPARLLLIGTCRPVDLIVREHPLRRVQQDLHSRGLCHDLALEVLTDVEVARYLGARFGEGRLVPEVARVIHRRTDGHPLFMVTVTDDLVRRGVVARVEDRWQLTAPDDQLEAGAGESLRRVIGQMLERCDAPDRRLLDAASVVGVAFSAATVATALEEDVEAVEARCEELARRGQLIRAVGLERGQGGMIAGRFEFRHAIHAVVLYAEIPPGRRARWHRRIGEGLERQWGAEAVEHAGELALHFERGGDEPRAVRYRGQAASLALRRWANAEARTHLDHALSLLATMPDTSERARQELQTWLTLGPVLMVMHGDAAPEVQHAYDRAGDLCRRVGTPAESVEIAWGAWRLASSSADLTRAREIGEELLALAERDGDSVARAHAHRAIGQSLLYLGDPEAAHRHLTETAAFFATATAAPRAPSRLAQNSEIGALGFDAVTSWVLGYPDRALRLAEASLASGQRTGNPVFISFALSGLAWVRHLRRDGAGALEAAEGAMALAREHELSPRWAQAAIFRGAALCQQGRAEEGVAQIREGLSAHLATGARIGRAFNLATLAAAELARGRIDAAGAAVLEALAISPVTGERWWDGELHRLSGEIELARAPRRRDEAEAAFRRAIELAREQRARALELRAVVSLGHLWVRHGKRDDARALVREACDRIAEGADTGDVRGARTLLKRLGG